MDLQLNGKRAFISGSTKGIGFAIARTLLEEGVTVVINGRNQGTIDRAVAALRTAVPAGSVSGMVADFTEPAAVSQLLDNLGEVDILVNNVGLFEVAPFQDIDDATWQQYFEVNVMSGVRLSRRLLPGMLKRNWGRVIFIGSESGVNIPADMLHYGFTKAGMLALGNGLAKLTRGSGVTVNTILGGPTYSDGVADTVAAIARTQGMESEDLKHAIIAGNQTSLLERFIQPQEIAHLAAYLASPLASATNGTAVRADGGVLTTIV